MEPLLEEVGEARLYLGGDGQGLECLKGCPVRAKNAPTARQKMDAAHLSLIEGTEFIQWYGRVAGGFFWPHGKLMRLTAAGVKHMKVRLAAEDTPDYEKRSIERILKQVKRHRVRR